MIKDGRIVSHDSPYEKVLGYKYSPSKDTMHLSAVEVDEKANSKRKILAESSKIFDPLSFFSPVTIRCKTFVSELWDKDLPSDHWDELISEEHSKDWSSLSKDLKKLAELEFPWYSLTEDEPVDLFFVH